MPNNGWLPTQRRAARRRARLQAMASWTRWPGATSAKGLDVTMVFGKDRCNCQVGRRSRVRRMNMILSAR